ncbi:MAG: hypothetical protein GEV13_27295 [Rhodospirillales bacterium]|nr:hypothetical protein [Rhodospirillales bacterium]
MPNAADAALVTDVARDVLSQIAPDELPIFPAASRAYIADPAAALRGLGAKDDVLGFGMDALAAAATPVVLIVVTEVFQFLTGVAAKAAADGLTKEISEIVKAMFKRFRPSAPSIPSVLTREHIAAIHGNERWS